VKDGDGKQGFGLGKEKKGHNLVLDGRKVRVLTPPEGTTEEKED
jgi:hypothetical protein